MQPVGKLMAEMEIIMDKVQEELLEAVAGLHETPKGAYNIRANGKSVARGTTSQIDIETRETGDGINIHIRPGTKGETVYIPVVMDQAGLKEVVYNDFFIGEDADVTIVAGCGIHNCGASDSQHDGIHRFFLGKNSKVKYVERHYGSGDGNGARIMNPKTILELEEGSSMDMESVQIKGVDSTIRVTTANVGKDAKLTVTERLMTHGSQTAKSEFDVQLNGADSSANIISRSVAKDHSHQVFQSRINGNAKCSGHSECDSIIMGDAKISAIPEITANNPDAALIHEAAIGKIAGDQIIKLMTLGLTEAEAEEQIVNGFLK